jgi:hypothetical protein
MSKKPPDPGVDLHIAQLYREGTIGTIWSRIYPHSHLSLVKWLNTVANKGPHPSALLAATAR